jgi:predicted permease
MVALQKVARRIRGLLSRTDAKTVSDELQLHIDLLTDEYRAQGQSEDAARARAEREFGNPVRIAERTREVQTYPGLEAFCRDIQYATRQLRKNLGVTVLAITSLAVGIGANAAIFSIVNALVLRPLAVPNPERLAALSLGDQDLTRIDGSRWSYTFWRAFANHRQHFDGVLAWSHTRINVSREDASESVDGLFVDGEFFATLGLPPAFGRVLSPTDDEPGAMPVVMISHNYWQRHFGQAPDVLGRALNLQGTPFTIVGVTSASFTGLEVGQPFDLALPISAESIIRGAQSFVKPPFDGLNLWLRIGITLRADQTLENGTAIVRGLQPQLRQAAMPPSFPQLSETYLREPMSLTSASNGLSRLRQMYRVPLQVLGAVAALVLLLACLNVANLLLGQATARGHELSVRLALGGSRWRVGRQLLIESALLSVAGLLAGAMLAQWAARGLISQFSAPNSPVALDLGIDLRVLAMMAAVGAVTTVLCGTAGALRVNAVTPAHTLADAARGTIGSRRSRISGALLTSQVCLSLTLVVGAGLFVGTFVRLASVPLGFDPEAVLLANANAARANIPPAERAAFYNRLVDAARAVPGVRQAAASTMTPVSASEVPIFVKPIAGSRGLAVEGEAKSMFVTPGWFETYGVSLLRGRDFGATDTAGAAPVMAVNQAFVDRFYAARSGLGETARIALGRKGELLLPAERTIIGVVNNSTYRSLREVAQPVVYIPLAQYDHPVPMNAFIAIGLRTRTNAPAALARDVATALTTLNPQLTVTTRTLSSQVRESIRQEQLLAALSGLFGLVALFLAATGLYGVTSYAVTRRRREFALRLAVGASKSDIIRTVLARIAAPLGLGLAAGIVLSSWLSRFVSGMLFGVEAGDPVTLAIAACVLVVTALTAAWMPARRAFSVSAVESLRSPI